jgi:hypothetical protein
MPLPATSPTITHATLIAMMSSLSQLICKLIANQCPSFSVEHQKGSEQNPLMALLGCSYPIVNCEPVFDRIASGFFYPSISTFFCRLTGGFFPTTTRFSSESNDGSFIFECMLSYV